MAGAERSCAVSNEGLTEFDRALGSVLGLAAETVYRARTGAGFRHRAAPVPVALPVRRPASRRAFELPRVELREVARRGGRAGSRPAPPRVALRRFETSSHALAWRVGGSGGERSGPEASRARGAPAGAGGRAREASGEVPAGLAEAV